MTAFYLPLMERMHINNSKQLRLCAALIIVSIFVYLPTTLVFGQNEAIHTISINEDGGSTNTNILASSRVEYNSSGWTDFTITALNATYQEDGVEKDFFDTNFGLEGANFNLERFIHINVYSGSSNKLIAHSSLFIFFFDSSFVLFDSWIVFLENESSISLVFYIINDNRAFEEIEFRYSMEAYGESVGIPTTLSPEDSSLPFSLIALIAALGSMVTLISVKRIKFRR